MSLLVTGPRGFIASRLVRLLREDGRHVVELPPGVDVCGMADFETSAEVVFHLAARNQERDFVSDPHGAMRTNVLGTVAALEYCRRRGARMVFASTSGVYAVDPSREQYSEDSPVHPARAYPASKAVAEELCAHYATTFGVEVVVLRLFNVYGPGQVKPFLIPDILEALRANLPLPVRMPNAVRDFVHVDDVVAAFLRAAEVPVKGMKVFNIGCGRGTTVREIVSVCEHVSGHRALIQAAPTDQNEVNAISADVSRARRELGWESHIPLEAGLAGTWEALVKAGRDS